MTEMKEAKKYVKTKMAVIIVGIVLLAMIVIVVVAVRPENNNFPQSTARAAEKISEVIVWSDPQQIKASVDRWSEASSVPSGKFGIAVQKGEKAEVLFSNGKYYLLDNYKQIEFGNMSGNFQFRGVNKDVVVYVYTAS